MDLESFLQEIAAKLDQLPEKIIEVGFKRYSNKFVWNVLNAKPRKDDGESEDEEHPLTEDDKAAGTTLYSEGDTTLYEGDE